MADGQNGYSNRTPSGNAASVQKRRTLYLAKSDPRVKNGHLSKYINAYYADVKILEDSEYVELLKSQIGLSFTEDGDPIEDTDPGPLVSTLYPPTNFVASYEAVTNNGSNLINVTITFDDAVDSAFQQGEELMYGYTTPTVVSASSPAATVLGATAVKPIDPTTIHFSHYNAHNLDIKWKGFSDAVGYLVTVTAATGQLFTINSNGTHVLSASKKVTYPQISPTMDSSGMITFIVPSPSSGHVFSGKYTFSIQVRYAKGTSVAKGGFITIV
jgi:hypothetical protein